MLKDFLRGHSLFKKLCYRLHFFYTCFKLFYSLFLCIRHKLDYKSTRLFNCIVLIHEDTKTY